MDLLERVYYHSKGNLILYQFYNSDFRLSIFPSDQLVKIVWKLKNDV